MTRRYDIKKIAGSAWTKLLSLADYGTRLAIIFAVGSYLMGTKDRDKQRHIQDWQAIDMARSQPGDKGRRLALEDLLSDGQDLTFIDLSGAFLGELDFRGAILDHAVFSDTHLQGAQFNCVLKMFGATNGTYLDCARRTRLNRATFVNVTYIEDTESNEELQSDKWRQPDFSFAELKRATFSQVRSLAPDATFWDGIIGNFNGADFTDAKFSDAVISSTSFAKAGFYETTFTNVRIGNGSGSFADFKDATFSGTKFVSVIIDGANFSGATLIGVIFEESQIHDLDLSNAKFLTCRKELGSSEQEDCNKVDGHTATPNDFPDAILCHTDFSGTESMRDCAKRHR